jgi:hypothetical protein
MAYTPLQDGTQAFGIPDSPLSINSVTYIAEDIQVSASTTVPEIKDPNGVPTGQVFIPQVMTLTAKLQLATGTTAVPAVKGSFSLQGATWYISDVGTSYTQGAYTYVNISARQRINA